MQPMNQSDQGSVDARYRIMLILWCTFFSTIGIYFVISQFMQRPEVLDGSSKLLTVAFSALGTFIVLISFLVKQKFLALSVEKQELGLVQTGFILALAMCEVGALIGLLALLLTGNGYCVLVLIIAAVGIMLHFPRRDHLLAAGYKRPIESNLEK